MKLGDMKTEDAIKNLNDHLADKSYIEGYQPSQSDTVVYEALSGAPSSSFPHALRWYNHIKSYGSDKSSFPGVKKDISAFGITAGGGGDNKGAEDDDDDLDLFGSDDEQDEEAEKLRQTRLDQYAAKKAKKPGVIAKSSVVLDVKPWDDETDMKEMERLVRTIETDGLKWGASKLMPLAYGIHKLQIMCVVEDEKCLRPALENQCGPILLHDKARPRVARITLQKLDDLGYKTLPHPPYSPDLVPTDYHFFKQQNGWKLDSKIS